MTFIELLLSLDTVFECIQVRTNSPLEDEEDMLFGYCAWNGKEIVSLDGDSYDPNEPLTKYEITETNGDQELTVWVESVWVSGTD